VLFVERYHDRKAVVVWKGKHCKSHCLHAVAYAENFHGGGLVRHLYLACAVCDVTI